MTPHATSPLSGQVLGGEDSMGRRISHNHRVRFPFRDFIRDGLGTVADTGHRRDRDRSGLGANRKPG